MQGGPEARLADRYALQEEVARGGMASVWRAQDEVLARAVAIKILHPHLAHDEAFLERFRREALAAARLTHPNIVAIYDTGSQTAPDGERHFIVMEFCGGGTLADMIGRERAIDAARVSAIGATIAGALAYAHAEGIVHRDIKPANVLVSNDGTLKVADFGIAKAAFDARDITTTGSVLGTVNYISPEQAQGEEPTACSDIYSLGVVMYELATGRPPFEAESAVALAMKHVRDEPPPPRSIRPGIPRALEAVILRCLAKHPQDRFRDARELETALQPGGAGPTTTFAPVGRSSSRSVPASERSVRAGGEWRWVAWLLGFLVLAAVIVAFVSGREDGGRASDRDGRRAGGGAAVSVDNVIDFDPHGGDGEHPEDARFAADGQAGTAWSTSSYQASFELLGKPGVGLLFDLGETASVDKVEITGSDGTAVELRAGDDAAEDETAFDVVASETLQGATTFAADGEEARYWLVWITALPGGGGGSSSIAEVRFFGE